MKVSFHILVLLLLSMGVSHAALYKWVDEKGNTHYTTTPPPDSAVYDREVIGGRGQVVKRIQGRMTPEEKAAYEEKLLEEERLVKEQEAQKKRDRSLLISYKTVEDVIEKRDDKLSTLDSYIESLEADRNDMAHEYDELLNQAVLHEREGKTPPEKLKADLRGAKRELGTIEADLEKAKKERLKAVGQFEEDLKRFRELKGL
jgi:hypothetical protein